MTTSLFHATPLRALSPLWRVVLAATATCLSAVVAWSEPTGLHDRPTLALDPGVHTAPIIRADVDAAGEVFVTGSLDKTVRLWSAADGAPLGTIRLPAGPGDVGKVYAVAISPDGGTVAGGGWTRGIVGEESIYLFSPHGEMVGRITGLPSLVNDLAFSPDGRRLAATLGVGQGLRLYDRDLGWTEIARDEAYGDTSYGVAFAPDGRLATTSLDGRLRLYDAEGARIATAESGGARPFGLAFSPDGARLAVGYDDLTAVRIFDGRDLSPLPAPDVSGIDQGDLSNVAWAEDGTLLAAGLHQMDGRNPVVAWADGGAGSRRTLSTGVSNNLRVLRPLPSGDMLVASANPWLGRIAPDGAPRWTRPPVQMDPREQRSNLGVSRDGLVVEFGFEQWGERRARFDVSALALSLDPPADGRASPPVQTGLDVDGWINGGRPTLDGEILPLEPYEASRSLAVHPDGRRFVLGADWRLRAFDAEGEALWPPRAVPGTAWAVNVSGDGRLVVAAYGDGTIRWHRMEDGAELLALFPFADGRNWVAWEPDGRFASTLGARSALRWHVNRGWDESPITVDANQIPRSHRPDVIRRVLTEGGTMQALYAADEAIRRSALQRLTGSAVPPGAQLHVLTIGVSDYARHPELALDWAAQDAVDLRAALRAQTEDAWPYVRGFEMALTNDEARGDVILQQLANIRERMRGGTGAGDLAVIHFAGHGAVVGEGEGREFHLLPHEADLSSEARIKRTGLSASLLRGEIAALAAHGRVLLLLDACRSGGLEGAAPAIDAALLRRGLALRNVTVLTSSAGDEPSWEHKDWRNGAFTEILLEAIGGRADDDDNGMVSIDELVGHVTRDVPSLVRATPGLSERMQRPDATRRFSGELFASWQ